MAPRDVAEAESLLALLIAPKSLDGLYPDLSPLCEPQGGGGPSAELASGRPGRPGEKRGPYGRPPRPDG